MSDFTSEDTCDSCLNPERAPYRSRPSPWDPSPTDLAADRHRRNIAQRKRVTEGTSRRAEHFGTCQICFDEQLLPGGSLALHGYKRPGTGEIYGRCAGSGALPYEQDVTLTTEHRELSARLLKQFEGELAGLKAHPPRSFVHTFKAWGKPTTEVVVKQGDEERYDEALHERIPSYASLLESAIYAKERDIRFAQSDLRLYTEKVVDWKLRPLKPVPPEGQKREWLRRSEESAARLQALRQQQNDLEKTKRQVEDAYGTYKSAAMSLEYRRRDAVDPEFLARYADLEAKEPGWAKKQVAHAEEYLRKAELEARKIVGPVEDVQGALRDEMRGIRDRQRALKDQIAQERAKRINPKTGLAPPKKFEWPKKLTDESGNVYNLAYKNGPEDNHTYLGKKNRKFARVDRNLETGEFTLTAEDYEPLRKPRALRPG